MLETYMLLRSEKMKIYFLSPGLLFPFASKYLNHILLSPRSSLHSTLTISRYVPLPDLAPAIRWTPVQQVVQLFKALASVVTRAYEMQEIEPDMHTDTGKCTSTRGNGLDG